jgi:DNA-directed RNA polymerase subunit M/transcription elongation factor TFIIS
MADDGFADEVFDDDDFDEVDEEDLEDEDNEDEEDEPTIHFAQPETKKSRQIVRIRKVQYDHSLLDDEQLIETLMIELRSAGFKKTEALSTMKKLKGQVKLKEELVDAVYDICCVQKNEWGFASSSFEEAKLTEEKEIAKLLTPLEVVEGIYVCPKCKNTKTQHYSVQLRRADEPPTVFIHCVNDHCKFKWREG